jgi:hypothetical protein
MDFQRKAYKIIYDITGTILRWDKQQLSDKEAMKEIVRTLASEADIKEEEEEEVVLLKNVEVNKESSDTKNEFYEIKKKKSSSVLVQKKVLAPMVIGVIFFAVLIGVTDSFTNNVDIKIVEEEQISFEQLNEKPSNIKEQNNSVVDEFSNKTISKKDS